MKAASTRLSALDAFRGFAIAAMVLVNNPGDWANLYPQLEHAHWNDWTFTDTIFPFFLFIGGMSMTLSLDRLTRLAGHDADRPRLLAKLARRAALIFLIGFALNLIPLFHWDAVRIPGVLQRIALCTLLAAPIVVYGGWRAQLATLTGLLAAYSALMLLVAVPDVHGVWSTGLLEPGRDTGAWLDRQLLGGHLWVQSKSWDPEGLLSTLPALGTQLIGVLAGRLLIGTLPREEQVTWLMLGGLLLLALGSILDALLMPINKSLWTPSFCLLMGGWAMLAFAAFYWLLDVNPYPLLRARARAWCQPLLIYGTNALAIFAVSGLVAKMLGFIKLVRPDGGVTSLGALLYAPLKALPIGAVNTSLLYALLFNGAMFALAWLLWRKGITIKV